MRRASICGKLYPIRTVAEIRQALNRLKEASAGYKIDPRVFPLLSYRGEKYTDREEWQTPKELSKSLVGDCEDIANFAVEELKQKGFPAMTWIIKHPDYYHIIVWCDGNLYDPCISRGMKIDSKYKRIMRQRNIIPL